MSIGLKRNRGYRQHMPREQLRYCFMCSKRAAGGTYAVVSEKQEQQPTPKQAWAKHLYTHDLCIGALIQGPTSSRDFPTSNNRNRSPQVQKHKKNLCESGDRQRRPRRQSWQFSRPQRFRPPPRDLGRSFCERGGGGGGGLGG